MEHTKVLFELEAPMPETLYLFQVTPAEAWAAYERVASFRSQLGPTREGDRKLLKAAIEQWHQVVRRLGCMARCPYCKAHQVTLLEPAEHLEDCPEARGLARFVAAQDALRAAEALCGTPTAREARPSPVALSLTPRYPWLSSSDAMTALRIVFEAFEPPPRLGRPPFWLADSMDALDRVLRQWRRAVEPASAPCPVCSAVAPSPKAMVEHLAECLERSYQQRAARLEERLEAALGGGARDLALELGARNGLRTALLSLCEACERLAGAMRFDGTKHWIEEAEEETWDRARREGSHALAQARRAHAQVARPLTGVRAEADALASTLGSLVERCGDYSRGIGECGGRSVPDEALGRALSAGVARAREAAFSGEGASIAPLAQNGVKEFWSWCWIGVTERCERWWRLDDLDEARRCSIERSELGRILTAFEAQFPDLQQRRFMFRDTWNCHGSRALDPAGVVLFDRYLARKAAHLAAAGRAAGERGREARVRLRQVGDAAEVFHELVGRSTAQLQRAGLTLAVERDPRAHWRPLRIGTLAIEAEEEGPLPEEEQQERLSGALARLRPEAP